MFCRKCGTELGPDERFCPGCGAPTAEVPAGYAAPASGDSLLARRTGPWFLAAVICESVAAAFSLIQLFFVFGSFGMINSYMGMMDEDVADMVSGVMSGMSVFGVLITLAALAITAVTLTGLWMTYASGVGRDKEPMLARGLKLVKGGVLAEMIYMIVAMSMIALGGLLLTVAGNIAGSAAGSYDYYYDYYYSYGQAQTAASAVSMVGIVLLVMAVALGALMVVFYVKARKAVGYALDAAQTGRITGAPSMFVAVMCFVLGGFGLLGFLLSSSAGGLGAIGTLTGAAANILFGIVAVQCRSKAQAA